jgi:hypothetical protein
MFKNVQTLHDPRFVLGEQLTPLAPLQIPIRSHVMNSGTNSNLNLP